MEITLYKNQSEKNKINKTLTGARTFSGTLREPSNVVDPEITIAVDNPTGYNYAAIPIFSRRYYIQDMQSVRTGVWKLSLHCDVLGSFADGIMQCSGVVDNGKTTGSNYIAGPQWVATAKKKTDIVNFSSGFLTSPQYILITSGG